MDRNSQKKYNKLKECECNVQTHTSSLSEARPQVLGHHNSGHYPEDNSVPYSSQFDGDERVSDLTLAELTKTRHTIIEMHTVCWIDFNLAFIIHRHANPLHIVDILIEAHHIPPSGLAATALAQTQ